MPISLVDTTAGFTPASDTTIKATMPTGATAGDLVIITASVSGSGDTFVLPSYPDWTLETELVEGAMIMRVLWRVLDGTANDDTPHMAANQASNQIVTAAAYRGVDPTTPFIAKGGQIETGNSSTTVHTAPALTNTDANAWLVVSAHARQVASPLNFTAYSPPSLVEREDLEGGLDNSNNSAACWTDSNGPVATGTINPSVTTNAGTAQCCTWAGLLAPASGGGAGTLAASGSGSLTFPTRTPRVSGGAALTGSGSLTFPTRTPRVSGVMARTGAGALAVTGSLIFGSTLARTGSGSLTFPTRTPRVVGSLPRTGSGTASFFGGGGVGLVARTGSGSLALSGRITAGSPFSTQEAVADGSFETAAWTAEPPRWSVDSTVARTGNRSMKAVYAGNVNPGYVVIGRYAVRPGDVVRVAAWRLTTADYNGTPTNGKLRIGSQTNSFLLSVGWDAGTTWAERVLTYTVPLDGSVTALQVTLGADHTTGTLWVDDVSVRMPLTTFILTGSGSLGFAPTRVTVAGAMARTGSGSLSRTQAFMTARGTTARSGLGQLALTPGGITTALQGWDSDPGVWRPIIVRAWDSVMGVWKLVAGRRARAVRQLTLDSGPVYNSGTATPAGIYSTGTADGPTGKDTARLTKTVHDMGWGALIAANLIGAAVPAGTWCEIRWWQRNDTDAGSVSWHIVTDPGTDSVLGHAVRARTTAWTLHSVQFRAERTWIPGDGGSAQRFRANVENRAGAWIEISDVQLRTWD